MSEKIYNQKRIILLWLVFILAAVTVIGMLWPEGDTVPAAAEPGWEPIYRGVEGKNQVAFAINVDWGEEYIPGFLETLSSGGIKATFFLTGRWTTAFPDVAKTIKGAGMEIGNHGYSHRSPNGMSYEGNVEEITKTEDAIRGHLGIKTTLFAPPSGEREDQVLKAAADLGYKTILWTADTIDWQKPSPDTIVQRIKEKLDDGVIILMHPTENTLAALPRLIEMIGEQGYTIVPVSELLKTETTDGEIP